MPHTFPCPRCGEMSQWEDNAFRPFCSERCKLIDLGAWANDGRVKLEVRHKPPN